MKKIRLGFAVFTAMTVAASVQAAMWTNNVDYTFSNVNNWTNSVFHTQLENLNGIKGTTAANHAQVDSGFATASTNAAFGITYIATGIGGTTAYVDILSGGTLKAQSLYVGHNTGGTQSGNLTLKTGGTLMGTGKTGVNSGTASIGSAGAGLLTIESGAAYLGNATLNLAANGTMKFLFGTTNVSTFVSERTTTGGTNLLNGLIQVDLGALTAAGTYTLLDSKTNVMSGALYTWLAGLGGSYSNTGDFANANFAVINAGTKKWTLSLADGNKGLALTVVVPNPAKISLFVVGMVGMGAVVLRRTVK